MTYLLFPGRHLLMTSFQESYLLDLLEKKPEGASEPITHIIFAVTSANQDNSRYNPISYTHRVLGIDRFCQELRQKHPFHYSIVPVPHYPPNDKFASRIISQVKDAQDIDLTPYNTIVLTSTEPVGKLFEQLGFSLVWAEYDRDKKIYHHPTPLDDLKRVMDSRGELDPLSQEQISASTLELWKDRPIILKKANRLWHDPLLTDSGSLTETRNYSSYAYDMGNQDIINFKYAELKEFIKEGKIVDEGCADGQLLVLVARDFPDSDIIGVDISSEFIARCQERQRAGEFHETYIYFHQRNILDPLFENGSIDITLCNSTTHELWSYGEGESSLRSYLAKKYVQTRRGGRLVIRDVVGPKDKENIVYLELNKEDGREELFSLDDPQLQEKLAGQSTYTRFLQFAKDYLADMRSSKRRGDDTKISYEEVRLEGKDLIKLRLKDACEFMTKKDYLNNWRSELNEEFAFWDFDEWTAALEQEGFTVLNGSHAYTNEWIVNHRYKGKIKLYELLEGKLQESEFPHTNMILVGEKNE
ncbi:MAG: methyltransferase domain-containing protein [Nanoarchaeota archaeon]|nr:methyltransferase domain-containing protein [Nanoarchaeota archaeon]